MPHNPLSGAGTESVHFLRDMMARLIICTFALVLLTLSNKNAHGDFISNAITAPNPSSDNPFTSGQSVAPNVGFSGIGRGTGITPSSAVNRYNASGWNSAAFDSNDYFNFIISPHSGYLMNLTGFTYTGQRSGTGPTSFAFRSSRDSFTANIGSPTATGTTINLTSAAFQSLESPIEFRLYGWGATGAGGTFSVNDFSFAGNVVAVPEPASITLAAIAVAGGFGVRRFRRRGQQTDAASPDVAGEVGSPTAT